MLFDTLELSKSLQRSFTPEQAETLVQALGKASSDQLATKADLAEVKSEIAVLRGELATFKVEVAAEFAASRSEFKALEASLTSMVVAQISVLRAETIKWVVSALVFNFIGIAGLVVTLARVFGK